MIVNPRRRIKSQGSKENQFSVLTSNGRKHPEGAGGGGDQLFAKPETLPTVARKKLSAHKLVKTITPGSVPAVVKK